VAINGVLHFATGCKNGRTFLKSVYNTPPFKLADISGNTPTRKLQLMLMSASPGVLEGDNYKIKIELAEGTEVDLATQSYQRLFQMKKGAAQSMEVYMDSHSSFTYLPYPVVPHKLSSFSTHNKVFLSARCTLIWGEVLTCGRQLNGETFSFTRYQNKTEIFIHGRLVVKENLFLQPAAINLNSIGQLEGYTHQASFIFINEDAPARELYTGISELLSNEKEITFGVSSLPVNGLSVRLLGYRGEQLYNCLQRLAHLTSGFSCSMGPIVNGQLPAVHSK
jgi:urease accessory protein